MHTHKNFPGNDDLFRRLYNIGRLLERLKTKAISSERVGLASMLEATTGQEGETQEFTVFDYCKALYEFRQLVGKGRKYRANK